MGLDSPPTNEVGEPPTPNIDCQGMATKDKKTKSWNFPPERLGIAQELEQTIQTLQVYAAGVCLPEENHSWTSTGHQMDDNVGCFDIWQVQSVVGA